METQEYHTIMVYGNVAKASTVAAAVMLQHLLNKTKDWALVHERELFRSDEYVVFGGLEIEWLENRRLLV